MKRLSLVLCTILLLAGAPAAMAEDGGGSDGPFQVVAHADFPLDSVSRDDLRKVFLGIKRSIGAAKAMPVTLSGGDAHAAFLKDVVGKSTTGFRLHWRKKVFSGEGNMPPAFDDGSAALLNYLRATPGAVGYVASGTAVAGLKVVALE